MMKVHPFMITPMLYQPRSVIEEAGVCTFLGFYAHLVCDKYRQPVYSELYTRTSFYAMPINAEFSEFR
jgi:hypothetical protein